MINVRPTTSSQETNASAPLFQMTEELKPMSLHVALPLENSVLHENFGDFFLSADAGDRSSSLLSPNCAAIRADADGVLSLHLQHMGVVLAISLAARSGRKQSTARDEPTGAPQIEALGDIGVISASVKPEGHADDLQTGRDAIVDRLSQALEAATRSDGAFADVYADAVRLAIVTRMLGLRSEPTHTASPPPTVLPAETATQTVQPPRTIAALPKWRLKRVLSYLDENLGEGISLTGMAAAAGLSRMHFAAQFRVATGLRPHEFLLRRRIERAQEMLLDTRDSLVEIALAVGFQTQAHFTTVFRRFSGETPHRWRCAHSRRN